MARPLTRLSVVRSAGLPSVRTEPGERRALDGSDLQPPTCRPDTTVGELTGPSLVINEQRVVLGRVRFDGHVPSARVVDVMEPGPTTVRANEPLDPLLERMQKRQVDEIVVTTPEGRLLGVVRRR